MKSHLILSILISLFLVGGAVADYDFHTLSEAEGIWNTGMAVSAWGDLVIVWTEADSGVWTQSVMNDTFEDPVNHGTGESPSVCWNSGGFTLAYIAGDHIEIKTGSGYSWSDIEVISSSSGELPMSIRLTGEVPYVLFDDRYLAWQEQDGGLWCSKGGVGFWDPPEYVGNLGDFMWATRPLALPRGGPHGLQPRVYSLGDYAEGLFYFDREDPLWSGPHPVGNGEWFGTNFDGAIGPAGLHHILANGPQPTCPCNVMNYICEAPDGGWEASVLLSEDSWPLYPSIDVSDDGAVHCFFYESYWLNLEFMGEDLLYFRMWDGVWNEISGEVGFPDAGIFTETLCDPRGEMLFLWTQGEVDPPHLTLGWDRVICSADPAPPALAPTLSAWPNPFNPAVKIGFALSEEGPARLEILDVRGRHVITLLDEARPAGEQSVVWRGRGEAGEALGSGVYFANLSTGGVETVSKLVLLK